MGVEEIEPIIAAKTATKINSNKIAASIERIKFELYDTDVVGAGVVG